MLTDFAHAGQGLYFPCRLPRPRVARIESRIVMVRMLMITMISADLYHIPNWLSLIVIVSVLTVTIVLSMRATRGRAQKKKS